MISILHKQDSFNTVVLLCCFSVLLFSFWYQYLSTLKVMSNDWQWDCPTYTIKSSQIVVSLGLRLILVQAMEEVLQIKILGSSAGAWDCESCVVFVAAAPALASSKKESSSGALAAWRSDLEALKLSITGATKGCICNYPHRYIYIYVYINIYIYMYII